MAQGENGQLEYGRELPYLEQKDTYLGSMLRRIVDSVNLLARNAGVSSVGKVSPPPPINDVNVQGVQNGNLITCPSEILHWTINHTQSVDKNIQYFSEVDTNPNFTQPHVIAHGAGRTGFLSLPTYSSTLNMTSGLPTSYYLRSYAQYPGSDPSERKTVGGAGNATQIQMSPPVVNVAVTGGTGTGTAASVTQLLPSTGSGTAQSTGQQGGRGLGTVLTRPVPGPKRRVGMLP